MYVAVSDLMELAALGANLIEPKLLLANLIEAATDYSNLNI
jgi:hypothetical protein